MELPLSSRGEEANSESCGADSNQGNDDDLHPRDCKSHRHCHHDHHMVTPHFSFPKYPETISKADKEREKNENLRDYPFSLLEIKFT